MLDWYIKATRLVREIRNKTLDVLRCSYEGDSSAAELPKRYLQTDYANLESHWKAKFPAADEMGQLGRHVNFGVSEYGGLHDYWDILRYDLPLIEQGLEAHLLEAKGPLYPETVVD